LNKEARTGRKRKPMIMVASSPSGGGKTTIVNDLLKTVEGIKRSISHTTRAPRKEEKEGEDYIFISDEEFRFNIEKDKFLEWEQNFGHFYGTSEEQVRETLAGGDDVILSIDVKGARRVKMKFPESISVFIMPPSIKALTERLTKRKTEGASQVAERLQESEKEIAAADEYDYMIVNEDIGEAVGELKKIIEAERKNRTIKEKTENDE